jgi:hypothetical protein
LTDSILTAGAFAIILLISGAFDVFGGSLLRLLGAP